MQLVRTKLPLARWRPSLGHIGSTIALLVALTPRPGAAQSAPESEAQPSPTAPSTQPEAAAAAAPLSAEPSPATADTVRWHERYKTARADLIAERYDEAASAFRTLAVDAPTPEDRHLASELGALAQAGLARRAQAAADAQPEVRTSDELTVLYTTALFYGLGTSAWLTLQLQPQTFGGALLPFVVITPAAVAIVALADSYRPLKHGIPHAIAAGLYLGFGEGLWLVGYQHAYARAHTGVSRWQSERVSTALWASASAGALVGALIGALRRPTPGRVSFTASAGIWGGLISSFAASALEPRGARRGEAAYLVGAIGYNAGLVAGVLFGPQVAPSVARVRFIDLGGLGGALLGAGGYALISNQRDARGSLASAAIGGALGLGFAWWATSDMPTDHSHDQLLPAIGRRDTGFSSLRPILVPTRDGFMASVLGAL